MKDAPLFDHVATRLSELDLRMIRAVPPGGNWTDIPTTIPSKRLDQIREMTRERGGVVRTTYYGRLHPHRPSYTISTYFNRPGNGCNIHPSQNRTLSTREAARLQSFPDSVRFHGSQFAKRIQVGNAVPVLLALAVGRLFPPGRVVDLFAGAGGMSLGFALAGHHVQLAVDNDEQALRVHRKSHAECDYVCGDLNDEAIQAEVAEKALGADLIVGGPPCQGWSFAGWHDHNDARNVLVWRFIELVSEVQPKAFVMENVQGLAWMAQGTALTEIKKEFARAGYTVNHMVLNAAHYGVPQRRIRVFVIGTKRGDLPSCPPALFAESATDLYLPPPITVEEAIADLPALEPGGGSDEIRWEASKDDVPYRAWCRGQIDFDEMYRCVFQARKQRRVA